MPGVEGEGVVVVIAVTTPTGAVGSRVVRLLVQAGERPVVLVRDPTRLAPDVRRACVVREADLTAADAVCDATAGVEALYWVNPPPADVDPIAGHARFAASAVAAVRANGIARVVFQSSVGAEARHGFGEIDGLAATEQRLDATGASVTHLRCGYFFTNLLMDLDGVRDGVLRTTLPSDQRIPWVDPRDIGEVAAARLLARTWAGRHTQGVLGPVDLSFADVAAVLGEVLGRGVRAEQISDAEAAAPLRALGLGEARIDAIVGMLRGMRGGFRAEDPRDVRSTTPTPLAAWAYARLRPLV